MFNDSNHLHHFKTDSHSLRHSEYGLLSLHETKESTLLNSTPSHYYHHVRLRNPAFSSHMLGIDLKSLMRMEIENDYVECI